MNHLAGKTALVTGGTSGIGLATAQRFAAEGAHVFISGRRQAELGQAVTSIGHGAVGVRGDVSDPNDLDAIYAEIAQRGRGLDILFANAGGGGGPSVTAAPALSRLPRTRTTQTRASLRVAPRTPAHLPPVRSELPPPYRMSSPPGAFAAPPAHPAQPVPASSTRGSSDGLQREAALRFACVLLLGRYR